MSVGRYRLATLLAVTSAVLAGAALAASPVFHGKSAQGGTITFAANGSAVTRLRAVATVLCITAYPASGSMMETFPFAPKATVALVGGRFTVTVPTPSKGHVGRLTGRIVGSKATGTLTVDYDKPGNVLDPATGFYVLTVYSCAARTTWTATS